MSPSLRHLVPPDLVFPELGGSDREAVLHELASRIAASGRVADADAVYRALREREALGTTGIGDGIAIPHCKLAELDGVVVAVGVARQGVPFEAVDGRPVRVLFTVLSPPNAPAEHLRTLAAISRWAKHDRHGERLAALTDGAAIHALLGDGGEPAPPE